MWIICLCRTHLYDLIELLLIKLVFFYCCCLLRFAVSGAERKKRGLNTSTDSVAVNAALFLILSYTCSLWRWAVTQTSPHTAHSCGVCQAKTSFDRSSTLPSPRGWLHGAWHAAPLMDVLCRDEVALRFHQALSGQIGHGKRASIPCLSAGDETTVPCHHAGDKTRLLFTDRTSTLNQLTPENCKACWVNDTPRRWICLIWGVNT